MKIPFLILFMVTTFGVQSYGYDSGIALVSEKGFAMHVYVNGKLYNKQPGKFVRVRSQHGLFHIEVKVFNPVDKRMYSVKKSIRTEKGFEMQYKLVFINSRPELKEIKKYPVYSRYYLNPNLYNRHPVS